MLFQLYDQSSPFNSTHHVLYPQNVDRVVTIDCDVTSATLPCVYASYRKKYYYSTDGCRSTVFYGAVNCEFSAYYDFVFSFFGRDLRLYTL